MRSLFRRLQSCRMPWKLRAPFKRTESIALDFPPAERRLSFIRRSTRLDARGFLPERDGHEVYYENAATRAAFRWLCCTAGRAARSRKSCAGSTTPTAINIILFDQRGCGKVPPARQPRKQHDLASRRRTSSGFAIHLGVERWQVFGGSWGSTLGLAYAQNTPGPGHGADRARHLHAAPAELQWFYQSGASWLFPDAFEKFLRRSRRKSAAT